MPTKLDLTIAIPVKNEEKNLPGCLASIGKDLAAKVVLIDSGSTDRTKEIACEYGVEVVDFKWNGKYPKKRNWFLQNYNIQSKWILFLDGDEYLTDEFKKELRQKLSYEERKVGFWLSYTVYFLEKELKGGYPMKKLALFRVGAGQYERIEEERWSEMDMEVHEHPILAGEVGIIKSKIDHNDFRGVGHYVNKHNEYSDWEAKRYLEIKKSLAACNGWTWKQKLKYQMMKSIWIGPLYFFGSFFFYGGFRDGSRGLAFALLKMSYFVQINCKIKELTSLEIRSVENVALTQSEKGRGLPAVES